MNANLEWITAHFANQKSNGYNYSNYVYLYLTGPLVYRTQALELAALYRQFGQTVYPGGDVGSMDVDVWLGSPGWRSVSHYDLQVCGVRVRVGVIVGIWDGYGVGSQHVRRVVELG